MDWFSERLSEEINLIGEGSHSLLRRKAEWPIIETDKMKPSATMIQGQNSSVISKKTWEIWDCECECESGFDMKMENVHGHHPFQKNIQKALIISHH
jgi:hypothetical protein